MNVTKEFFQHPLALVDSEEVGVGTRVWAWAHVLEGAIVGAHCNIGEHSYIEGDSRLGDNVTVKNGVSVWAGVTVEDNCFLGPNCAFTNDLNPRAYIKKDPERLLATIVKAGASIGANATIICGNTIGRYAFVGAGATVTVDVADHALVVGTPARQIAWMCTCAQKIPLSQKHTVGEPLRCDHCGCEYTETKSGLVPVAVQAQN
ncbi:transferase, hexapeptide repeat protein [Candidatus Koribacter versatilis Ellin345]|uniref:Transferase, hexapeptide repeat protein n=1 Tax=Koribacter versatilis (strain Ellin345) TaxID=204669 RepID=Q1ISR7_KORVE|nr:acyltransferase [Candidatus Koribacter versatilis]ABF40083.1 transferase, hexapeptide repeat protein [Candidatus Koribacter versatilis Ellin345]